MGFIDNIVLSELNLSESDETQLRAAAQDIAHITATIKAIMPRIERVVSAADLLAQRLAQKGTTA